jgi:hypothetical protein
MDEPVAELCPEPVVAELRPDELEPMEVVDKVIVDVIVVSAFAMITFYNAPVVSPMHYVAITVAATVFSVAVLSRGVLRGMRTDIVHGRNTY